MAAAGHYENAILRGKDVAGAVFGANLLSVGYNFAWQAQYLGQVGKLLVPRVFRRLCLEFSIACAAGVCSVRCLPLSIGLLCLVSPWFLSLAFLSKWLLSLASIWPLGLPAHWLLCLASI